MYDHMYICVVLDAATSHLWFVRFYNLPYVNIGIYLRIHIL